MSLVNDMLRDLDQRRKDSDSSSAPVSLTPASEIPRMEKKSSLMLIAGIVILISAGLGYFWIQSDRESEPRQLNIRPEVALENGGSNEGSTESVPASNPSNIAATAPETDVVTDPITRDASISEQTNTATVIASDAINTAGDFASNDSANASDAGVQISNSVQPNAAGGQPDSSTNSVAQRRDERPESPESIAKENTPISSAGESAQDGQDEVPSVVIRDGEQQDDSIKDPSEVSPEVQDTLIVQEALALIANGQNDAAYTTLETFIADNRYAHQSRETYAKLLMSQNRLEESSLLVEAGLQLAPNHSGFKKVKARLLISDGSLDEAVELLMSRAPEMSQDLEYHDILASAQLASRDFEGAAISYTGLVQHNRGEGKWWYGFAASQDLMGNRSAARQAYTQAMQQGNLSANLRRRSQDRLSLLSQ